jgi:hypothetical protein
LERDGRRCKVSQSDAKLFEKLLAMLARLETTFVPCRGVEARSGRNKNVGLVGLPFHDLARRAPPGSRSGTIGLAISKEGVSDVGEKSVSGAYREVGGCDGPRLFGVGESHSMDARFFNRETMRALDFAGGGADDLEFRGELSDASMLRI